MKKLLVGTFLGILSVAGVAFLPSIVSASGEEIGEFYHAGWGGQDDNRSYRMGVSGADDEMDGGQDTLIDVIRTAINWVLGMLSLVALVIALYAGFLMMTSGGDEKKYGKGVGLLKWAGIGLAVIALAWLIVSLIFWIINGAIGGGSDAESGGDSPAPVQSPDNGG